MCEYARRDEIRNVNILDKVGTASWEYKIRETRLRCFGHVKRRCMDGPEWRCDGLSIMAGEAEVG